MRALRQCLSSLIAHSACLFQAIKGMRANVGHDSHRHQSITKKRSNATTLIPGYARPSHVAVECTLPSAIRSITRRHPLSCRTYLVDIRLRHRDPITNIWYKGANQQRSYFRLA